MTPAHWGQEIISAYKSAARADADGLRAAGTQGPGKSHPFSTSWEGEAAEGRGAKEPRPPPPLTFSAHRPYPHHILVCCVSEGSGQAAFY